MTARLERAVAVGDAGVVSRHERSTMHRADTYPQPGRPLAGQPLDGTVALVTGGGRGIGRVTAVALAQVGTSVVAVARSRDEVEETAAIIEGSGGRAIGLSADVADRAAVEAVVAEVEGRLGPVDVLVNNAGIGGPNVPLWECDPEAWWRVLEVNLRGPMLLCRAVLPAMIRRRSGVIVNVGSYAGIRASMGGVAGTAYPVSKAALVRFTDTLAASVDEHGVRVFTISPGLVRTAMTEGVDAFDDVPENAWTPPEAAASLVVRLASGEGAALNGCFIHVGDDLDALLREAERIGAEGLYTLRLIGLEGLVP